VLTHRIKCAVTAKWKMEVNVIGQATEGGSQQRTDNPQPTLRISNAAAICRNARNLFNRICLNG
ncbi:hypothetical protein O5833_29185, partial [Escherichia coli]|nr:hypothetical protein [Escherichia coli]